MKIKPFFLVSLFTLTILSGLVASDERVKTYVDEYYPLFNAQREGDSSLWPLYNRFHAGVPGAIRAEVLSDMLNKARSEQSKSELVVWHILGYLESTEPNLANDPRVDQGLSILVKDPNPDLRRKIIMFLYSLKRDKNFALFVEALNDPVSKVQAAGITAMYGRPGSEVLYQKFIQNHQSDPAYDQSVNHAKEMLEASRQGVKMNGRGIQSLAEAERASIQSSKKTEPALGTQSIPKSNPSQTTVAQAQVSETKTSWKLILAMLVVVVTIGVVVIRLIKT